MAPVLSTQRDAPKKKALLVAVTYRVLAEKHPNEQPPLRLDGTLNDPPRLKKLLVGQYKQNSSHIVAQANTVLLTI